jgi:cell division protein FtsI (penicillin-binding protein 3)
MPTIVTVGRAAGGSDPMSAGSGDHGPVVPDLRGLSARDALRTLARLGLVSRIHGTGIVVDQAPAPGSLLERGATCTLVLDRAAPRSLTAGGDQP